MFSLLHGVPWVHIIPALFALVFTLLYLKTRWIYLKVLFVILWLLLIPNTAYIFTDVERITLQWNSVSTETRTALVIQYILLETIGFITYLLAMLPFEGIIRAWHFSKKEQILAIILFNFLIGFGMVLGRTGYINSYLVFTQPAKVFLAAGNIFMSLNLLELVVLFGIICNCIYFVFRNILVLHAEQLL